MTATPSARSTEAEAIAACTAYAVSQGKNGTYCADGWDCPAISSSLDEVCYSTTVGGNPANYCWGYSGSEAGNVYSTSVCNTVSATWK